MRLFVESILEKRVVRQFISYFFVGGTAALVEWFTFWVCNAPFGLGIYVSTIISFVCATTVNWLIARKTTFKKEAVHIKASKDVMPIFIISGVGLGLNLLLMWLISGTLGIYPLLAKIIATGIVFFWNFSMRKILVYR